MINKIKLPSDLISCLLSIGCISLDYGIAHLGLMKVCNPLFITSKVFVCLYEKDGSKFPYSAEIMAIKEIGGTQYYMIHYRRRKKTTDIRIPIGEENGRMFNGTLKEYGDKFNVEISSDAWEAEKKDKRKAVDDLETSLEKKGELWRRIHMSYSVFFK
ncbi:hypothetical protein L3Y34_011373 [Caenorhabditis briggsae]|uniref:Uncharacterized protein n=1 Tax=Caenorhabditis briggsae TaxID=6238 RepID=A0AAE8ZLK4_CAEBR|nr:hypothetical protein L3Y34_011373 [Caenorhabditis briggsae]